ncbi:MAG TPA: NAD(P)-dependent oxidoreductase [Burkholderiaceae bacterium]|nr:NAD(P)-dependent oxidoreductase [Burkholderiaceae bacterium]
MKRVLYLSHAPPEVYSIIRDAVPAEFELVTLDQNSDDERREKIGRCEVVIVAATPLRKPMIDAAQRLELVHHQGVGWQDTTDHIELKQRAIPLALTPEGTTVGVAEHTVLLMLAALKLLPFADSELRQGRFHVNALRPVSRELSGLTVGYVGMGRIAQAVAQRLSAFGTHGIFFDPAVSIVKGLQRKSFEQVLQEADIITLHLPLTAETRYLIGGAEIAQMKRGAYLINAARGGLIDEAALESALKSGHLAAAALDVFESEPVLSGHPLSHLKNIVLTPHIAAGTRDALQTKMRALFSNVQRFYRGEPMQNRVF